MSLRPSNAASMLLTGVIATTSLIGIDSQTAKANNGGPSTTAQLEKKSQRLTPFKASSAKPSGDGTSDPPKAFKSSAQPIEPFIRADVVALGQWLMIKTVKTLVNQPAVTPATEPVAAAKPNKPAQPSPAASPQPTLPNVAVRALPPEPSSNPTIDNYTEMRVAVTKQAPSVTVAASQGGILFSANGELIENLSANVAYQVRADANGLFVNNQPVPTAVWLEADEGYIAVGDRWYRGRLLLLWQDSGVMAVNHVLLRDYLYSVVGAEMSASWSLEALKAQAVAARSYAIVHTVRHQRRTYDLDDTQRYQVYKGIVTEARSTQQAVHETAGEFISYGGGVVESLYAANQEIVDDAHSGFGMSQTGALDLAEQGYRYYEILSAYYPDTSVGRIDIAQ